jgi:hypothetical protein
MTAREFGQHFLFLVVMGNSVLIVADGAFAVDGRDFLDGYRTYKI